MGVNHMFLVYAPGEHDIFKDEAPHCADCYNEDNEYNDKVVCAIQENPHVRLLCLAHALARFGRFLTNQV